MKRIKIRLVFLGLALCACSKPARAQFIGYTSPQTVQQNVFSATSCNGTAKSAPIQNAGQSVHLVSYSITGSTQPAIIRIMGSFNGVDFAQLSDDGMNSLAPSATNGVLIGYGYYPVIEVFVFNGAGSCSVTAKYSGTSVSPPNSTGSTDITAYQKNIFSVMPANATASVLNIVPPYGNAGGLVIFYYTVTGPSGSTLSVTTLDSNSTQTTTLGTFALGTGASPQVFYIPNFTASQVNVTYTSGGASIASFDVTYFFAKPGLAPIPLCDKSFIINTAAAGPTKIISNNGSVTRICSIDVSSATAEGIDFQQGTGANCGTGNSQLTGVYHAAVNTPVIRIFPGAGLPTLSQNDTCIHLSGANQTDGTITYSQQ